MLIKFDNSKIDYWFGLIGEADRGREGNCGFNTLASVLGSYFFIEVYMLNSLYFTLNHCQGTGFGNFVVHEEVLRVIQTFGG